MNQSPTDVFDINELRKRLTLGEIDNAQQKEESTAERCGTAAANSGPKPSVFITTTYGLGNRSTPCVFYRGQKYYEGPICTEIAYATLNELRGDIDAVVVSPAKRSQSELIYEFIQSQYSLFVHIGLANKNIQKHQYDLDRQRPTEADHNIYRRKTTLTGATAYYPSHGGTIGSYAVASEAAFLISLYGDIFMESQPHNSGSMGTLGRLSFKCGVSLILGRPYNEHTLQQLLNPKKIGWCIAEAIRRRGT